MSEPHGDQQGWFILSYGPLWATFPMVLISHLCLCYGVRLQVSFHRVLNMTAPGTLHELNKYLLKRTAGWNGRMDGWVNEFRYSVRTTWMPGESSREDSSRPPPRSLGSLGKWGAAATHGHPLTFFFFLFK